MSSRCSILCGIALLVLLPATAVGASIELREGVPDKRTWEFDRPAAIERFDVSGFGLVALPKKFNSRGVLTDRSLPILVTASDDLTLPKGEYRILLRSRNGARLKIDGKVVATIAFIDTRGDGHEPVPEKPTAIEPGLRPLAIGHKEKLTSVTLDGANHRFELEAFVGGTKLRPEVGELIVAISGKGEPFRLLGTTLPTLLNDDEWNTFAAHQLASIRALDDKMRRSARAAEDQYWQKRHEWAREEWAKHEKLGEPKAGDGTLIDRYLAEQLQRQTKTNKLVDDWTFLRRAFLDTVGDIPTEQETSLYFRDSAEKRRINLVDRLLADARWADHWVSYWQDVLAENPGILKPNLNNTGPFRWWLHQTLQDNFGMDRFMTELVRMEGSKMYGGPAGFAVATENDSPMAAKAHILTKAFLGMEMQCARCHDAPFHPFRQRELFELAAMLGRGTQQLPKASTVPIIEGGHKPRVTISMKAGEKIAPRWPFAELKVSDIPAAVRPDLKDSREQFAASITSPGTERFVDVLVNRLWKRYMGWGLVEPVDDWPDPAPPRPPVMRYLARELGTHGYDLKHVARLVLNSHAYQSEVQHGRTDASTDTVVFGPVRRRMTAEQVVDGMFTAAGKPLRSEELSMDPEGRRPASEMQNLGVPQRAWQFTSLSNERDRPALALPMAQSIVDLLIAYGWRDSRQNPITHRDDTPTPLQSLVLANGTAGNRIVRLSDDSRFTAMCLDEQPLSRLVERLFQAVLTRPPGAEETRSFVAMLEPGYAQRLVSGASARPVRVASHTSSVSWANHLSPEATKIKLELERAARAGDPPTTRLTKDWRERFEDAVWTLLNSPEFVFVP